MLAFGTKVHSTNGPAAGGTLGMTETPFRGATLSAGELSRIGNLCNFIIANGAGSASADLAVLEDSARPASKLIIRTLQDKVSLTRTNNISNSIKSTTCNFSPDCPSGPSCNPESNELLVSQALALWPAMQPAKFMQALLQRVET